VEFSKVGELPPVEITVHVLAPAFVDPAPVGASFETISVRVGNRRRDDVTCVVQALGDPLNGGQIRAP